MAVKVTKLTISIPHDLITLTDEIAKEWKVSRSKVFSTCLQVFANKRLREEMVEGYRVMAEGNLQFAREAMEIAPEVLPEWK